MVEALRGHGVGGLEEAKDDILEDHEEEWREWVKNQLVSRMRRFYVPAGGESKGSK